MAKPLVLHELHTESRAPPPSPITCGSGSGSGSTDTDDELIGFLRKSLQVPKLSLPERVVPRKTAKTPWNPPSIDLQLLISRERGEQGVETLKSAAANYGCFQIVNHGVSGELVGAVERLGREMFKVEREKTMERLKERNWGFEIGEEGEGEEVFSWSGDWGNKVGDLAGISTHGFMEFREKMEGLWIQIESIAAQIERCLLKDVTCTGSTTTTTMKEVKNKSFLCLHRHVETERERENYNHNDNYNYNYNCNSSEWSVKHEILHMLVRDTRCSRALSLYCICDADAGSTEFRVYTKKGCARFRPKETAIVVTVGDQIQAKSGGLYKNVTGKPVYQNGDHRDSISLEFIYSPRTYGDSEKIVSVFDQVILAACLALLYQALTFFFS